MKDANPPLVTREQESIEGEQAAPDHHSNIRRHLVTTVQSIQKDSEHAQPSIAYTSAKITTSQRKGLSEHTETSQFTHFYAEDPWVRGDTGGGGTARDMDRKCPEYRPIKDYRCGRGLSMGTLIHLR